MSPPPPTEPDRFRFLALEKNRLQIQGVSSALGNPGVFPWVILRHSTPCLYGVTANHKRHHPAVSVSPSPTFPSEKRQQKQPAPTLHSPRPHHAASPADCGASSSKCPLSSGRPGPAAPTASSRPPRLRRATPTLLTGGRRLLRSRGDGEAGRRYPQKGRRQLRVVVERRRPLARRSRERSGRCPCSVPGVAKGLLGCVVCG